MFAKSIIPTFALMALALAIDPTPSERAKWDAVCMEKAGSQFRMTFDSNGKPTGSCEAPSVWKCYWGPYKDPKTGTDGCCGKDKGIFSTDSTFTQEGGCCVSPTVYNYDNVSGRGGCCPSGQSWAFDANAGQGGCCPAGIGKRWIMDSTKRYSSCCSVNEVVSIEIGTNKPGCCLPGLQFMTDVVSGVEGCCPSGKVFSFDRTSNQSGCCDPGTSFMVDTATSKGGCCPTGKTYTVDPSSGKGGCCPAGISWKVDASTGHGSCCAADNIFSCECSCKPKPCNVGTGFLLRACIHDLNSECREYTDPTCSQIGVCHDLLAATNGVSSYVVNNGCCDFYGSQDCSGPILNQGCNKQMSASQIIGLGLNDKLNSAKCRYP